MSGRALFGQPGVRVGAADLQEGDETDYGQVIGINYDDWTTCTVTFFRSDEGYTTQRFSTQDTVVAFALGLPRLSQAAKIARQEDQEAAPAKTLEEARYAC